MDNLRLLYLSYNQLKEVPANLPPNVIELRFHENNINKIQKDAFFGLRKLNVLGETCFYLLTFFGSAFQCFKSQVLMFEV